MKRTRQQKSKSKSQENLFEEWNNLTIKKQILGYYKMNEKDRIQFDLANPHLANPHLIKETVENLEVDIEEGSANDHDANIPNELADLNDHHWRFFFKDYLQWIFENFEVCLTIIPRKITIDALQQLPFAEGGFDDNFVISDTEPTDFKKLEHRVRLYDLCLKNITKGNGLRSFNKKVFEFLCEAIKSQLNIHKYTIYTTMIFLMEIMVCKAVFDRFMKIKTLSTNKDFFYFTPDDDEDYKKKGIQKVYTAQYYKRIFKNEHFVFGLTASPDNDNTYTVGQFIINYARRLLNFTITTGRFYNFEYDLPRVDRRFKQKLTYSANLCVVLLPPIQYIQTTRPDVESSMVTQCSSIEVWQWNHFFDNYLNWIDLNFAVCLTKIPTKITLENFEKLTFNEGGFDKEGGFDTVIDNFNMYTEYLINIKLLKTSTVRTTLMHYSNLVSLHELCDVLDAKLTSDPSFFTKMISYMEIMCCKPIFDDFIQKNTSVPNYYDNISTCESLVFDIEKPDTIGYFIHNYARRLMMFAIKQKNQYSLLGGIPTIKGRKKYTTNLNVLISPMLKLNATNAAGSFVQTTEYRNMNSVKTKRPRKTGGNHIKVKIAEYKDKIKNIKAEYKEKIKNIKAEKLKEKTLIRIEKLQDKIKNYNEKLKIIKIASLKK